MSVAGLMRFHFPPRLELGVALGAALCAVTVGSAPAVERAAPAPARIVNGTPTSDFPAVGILLSGGQFCSATLIGCETVLTAAHCVCDPSADTAAQCRRAGGPDPSSMAFLPQVAPSVGVRAVTIHPDYDFGRGGDVAVIKLEQPVSGIAPLPFNRAARPPLGTGGTVVGYGRVGGSQASRPEVGIKRRAAVVSAQCPRATAGQPGIPSENHVCVTVADGDDAGTCQGDSGGPFLADFGDGPVVAGVTSGGATDRAELDCLPQSVSFFTDVFRYRNFVAAQLDGDGATCDGLDAVGAPGTALRTQDGVLAFPASRFETTLEVPAAAEALRVNMNGEFLTAGGFNDFDLFVNFGAPASAGQSLCSDTSSISFGACELRAPAAGTWHVAVESFSGAGRFQLVTALFGVPTSGVCAGDCDGDGAVRIDELIRCVSIAGGGDLGTCGAIDLDLDGGARIEELVAAVNAALQGC